MNTGKAKLHFLWHKRRRGYFRLVRTVAHGDRDSDRSAVDFAVETNIVHFVRLPRGQREINQVQFCAGGLRALRRAGAVGGVPIVRTVDFDEGD